MIVHRESIAQPSYVGCSSEMRGLEEEENVLFYICVAGSNGAMVLSFRTILPELVCVLRGVMVL
jgi:hypothetical protein